MGADRLGRARITITLGVLFDVMVAKQNGVITDPNIDAYEWLVDQFCTWLMGPRKFATFWSAERAHRRPGGPLQRSPVRKERVPRSRAGGFLLRRGGLLMADPRFYGPDSLAGRQAGRHGHPRNYKMANWVAYQRRL